MKWLLALLWCSSAFACEIRVATAANLGHVISGIGDEFERLHPSCHVAFTLGSSGKLAAQILNGAPYDIFLAADMKRPRIVCDEGHCLGEVRPYARGKLLLLSVKPGLLSSGIQSLRAPEVRRIALANPRLAPYGEAAMEILEAVGLAEELQPKLVFGESVGQALQFTLKAADAGFVAASSLYSEDLKAYHSEEYHYYPAPSSYTPLDQGGVLLKGASGEARDFYQFLFGEKAQGIFKSSGYWIPKSK